MARNGRVKRIREFKLPDDILSFIFMFLPIAFAAQTVAVSKVFKNTWLFCQNLDFNSGALYDFSSAQKVDIINFVLNNHLGSKIKTFRLCFDPLCFKDQFRSWISKLIEKGIEDIDLHFLFQSNFDITRTLSNARTIKYLKLTSCFISRYPLNLRVFPSLKSLILIDTDINLNFLQTVFSECSNLENLELGRNKNMPYMVISAPLLRVFNTLTIIDCPNLEELYIDAPTLRNFVFSGTSNVIFNFINIIQLKYVSFCIYRRLNDRYPIRDLVSSFAHINYFSFTSTLLKAMTSRYEQMQLQARRYRFWNLKEARIHIIGAYTCKIYDVFSFLWRSPCLEKFYINFEGQIFGLSREDKKELERKLNIGNMFSNLKFIRVSNFQSNISQLLMIKFFLEMSPQLETIALVFPLGRYHSKRHIIPLAELYHLLKNYVKASPKVEIIVCEEHPLAPK